ncbi:aminoacyl-tRNA hydrolase [Pantoea sp. Mhis]|uniref:aminoacyl-tRNA hydrolase n=1 Tax=Pantoea sp. Mhis TaxID=2576759 RepID=UPI00135A7EE7|nr:aminoacyl-tRNA hydrolase [Pantoea sp. Mhis]MXP56168.1 aminoacyl-tRNA hydrolase [Pantoea sp. Mhis]
MTNIKLIVGLENPGSEYFLTRHNTGGRYIKQLAIYYNQSFKMSLKFFGYTTRISLNQREIHLLVPNTFINLSGKAIETIATFYQINSEEILVAHDEMHLHPGIVKFKQGGGHGGHNGVRNIIERLKNNNFYRLRIGIGHPEDRNKLIDFVLGKPTNKEQKLIDDAINEAVCCTILWLEDSKNKAINRLNAFQAYLN